MNPYQTPSGALTGAPEQEGALYYGTLRGQRVAVLQEQGDELLCSSATFYGWVADVEVEREA